LSGSLDWARASRRPASVRNKRRSLVVSFCLGLLDFGVCLRGPCTSQCSVGQRSDIRISINLTLVQWSGNNISHKVKALCGRYRLLCKTVRSACGQRYWYGRKSRNCQLPIKCRYMMQPSSQICRVRYLGRRAVINLSIMHLLQYTAHNT